ncbi:hypothetical protein L484_007510 [Morus notabilis]|uniref:Uncharacterized protein n=1 Tax=Morus notabilis TaxID=981085 RepID=W9SD37_9ROSA|nr:hypothetical protein L484_007510 [Morus notabilis]
MKWFYILVPTSGLSSHLPLMQMSWPLPSSWVWHGPTQEEMTRELGTLKITVFKMRGREIRLSW